MRNRVKLITLLSLTLFVMGCKNNLQKAETVLSIDPYEAKEKIFLSDLVDSVSYIKLETNPECIMGRITQIIIKKKYIYVLDHDLDIVCLFDKKGRFISKLDKSGKGPGEYIHLGPVLVNESESYVEVLEHVRKNSRKLKYSIPDFKLIEESLMSIPSANSCRKLDGFYYFSTQQIDNFVNGKPTNADIIIVDGNNNKQKTLFEKNIITEGNYYSFLPESFTVNEKDELFVSLMFNPTFYQLTGWDATPVMTIDFGKYGIDNSIGLESTKEQLKYLDENGDDRAYFPVLNANTANLWAMTYAFRGDGSTGHQYLRLKKRNKTFHTKKIIDDVTGFKERDYICSSSVPVNHEVLYDDNYLVDIILPYDYLRDLNEKEIDGIGNISDQDNPIIVLMRLKK